MHACISLIDSLIVNNIYCRTFLNGYFLAIGFYAALEDQYNTPFMNYTALIMSICELILYADLLLGKIFFSIFDLIRALYVHDTTYVQSKVIAIQLKSLSTLSMLRYMPSVEIVSSFVLHWKQTIAQLWAGLYLLFQQQTGKSLAKRRNICEIIFVIPVYIIEAMAPLFAYDVYMCVYPKLCIITIYYLQIIFPFG